MLGNKTSNVIDQPAKAGEDSLNLSAYADALSEFLRNAQSPLTVAIQGEWGSGKTSLMNALKASLVDAKDAPFLGVWINTWQYALMADSEEAIKSILLGIIGQISSVATTSAEERGTLFRKLARVGGGVVSDIFKKYSGVDVEKNLREWSADGAVPAKSGVEDLKDELAGLVAKALQTSPSKRGFLFFIDDLDRIDPPVAVQILELLKNIFDLDRCIFVLAIDYGVVVKGLKPKFGAMTPENEREFRSFFDKIIQLPFSMPVGSYKIDGFLMSSLADIGYLDGAEKDDKSLCEALTAYALDSVGTNPRSLKRLINYLSLIRLLIGKTETKEDDADLKKWKDVLFALVSLQIQYPKVYDALLAEPDFPNWGAEFEQAMRLPSLADGESEKLKAMAEFDEPWEQRLFRFCRRDAFLEARALNISRILNRVKARIAATPDAAGGDGGIGETVQWLMRLSAVTSVKSEPAQSAAVENFNASQYLKDLRGRTLGLEEVWNGKGKHGWEGMPSAGVYCSCWQGRVQSCLITELWIGKTHFDDGTDDGFLTEPQFRILHDGKSFQLKINGEVWGKWPQEKYKGIDFAAESIQADLKAAETAYCAAWSPLGVVASVGKNIGHYPANIWFNVTIPFKDHDELVSAAFSEKLRGSLAAVANAFASLTKYRVFVNQ